MTDIARTMFGVGGLILHPDDPQKFLLLKKSTDPQFYNQDNWELLFGRKNALETIEDALHREAAEEVGITDLKILYPLRLWHFFRGERIADKEILGITFVCATQQTNIHLSDEHIAYEWVTADEALARVTVAGIRRDIAIFASNLHHHLSVSNPDDVVTVYGAHHFT